MVLIEWDTPEKQKKLQELLQKDGKGIPNNLVIDTAIGYSIDQRYPESQMRYFSTKVDGESTPKYVFVFEENKAFSGFYARPPPSAYDEILLKGALNELLDQTSHLLERDGGMMMLSDSFTRDVLHTILPCSFPAFADVVPPAKVEVFYMTDAQMQMTKEMPLPVVEGFHADSVDMNVDPDRIHNNWIHSASLESTKARLRCLPASVVRDSSSGEAVAWNMSSPYGQCSNLFTIPEFRGRGLAVLAQLFLAKKFVNQGLRPFKYVETFNTRIIEATRRHPVWTRWEEENEDDDDENEGEKKQSKKAFAMNITTIRKRE